MSDTPDRGALRAQVRDFIAAALPADIRNTVRAGLSRQALG